MASSPKICYQGVDGLEACSSGVCSRLGAAHGNIPASTVDTLALMTLAGSVDVAQRTRLSGWAMRSHSASLPVELVISVAATLRSPGRPIGKFLANRYRSDLDPRATGFEGRLGFDIDLRDFELPDGSFVLDVQDAGTGVRVPGAPHFIPAANFNPGPSPMLLAEIDGRPVARLPGDVHPCVPLRDGKLRIELPADMAGIMLCTRTRSVPGDARRLGAVLSRVAIDGATVLLDSPCFAFGFHEPEGEHGEAWRWIADAAFLGVGRRANPSVVTLEIKSLLDFKEIAGYIGWPWRLSARFRSVEAADAGRPSVGSRWLGPPLSPPKRRLQVRPALSPRPEA